MKYIYLNRCRHYPKETLGVITFSDYQIASLENSKKIIPKGVYKLSITYSPKFKCMMPILDVPGRRGIRIHTGNSYRDTTGCILVGKINFAERYLYQSRETYKLFFDYLQSIIKNEDIYLVVH